MKFIVLITPSDLFRDSIEATSPFFARFSLSPSSPVHNKESNLFVAEKNCEITFNYANFSYFGSQSDHTLKYKMNNKIKYKMNADHPH